MEKRFDIIDDRDGSVVFPNVGEGNAYIAAIRDANGNVVGTFRWSEVAR